AFTPRTKAFALSVIGLPKIGGQTIRTKINKKKIRRATVATRPNNVGCALYPRSPAAVSSLLERFSPVVFELRSLIATAFCPEPRPATAATGRANHGSFSRIFTAIMAVVAAHNVASNAVPTIAVGLVDPAATKIAIAVVGISCTDAVLIARNVHMALVAAPGCGLSDSRSRIARK